MTTEVENEKMLDKIEGKRKYYVTSELVSGLVWTAHLSGLVWASDENEAIEKFQSDEVIGEINEEPARDEINLNAWEV